MKRKSWLGARESSTTLILGVLVPNSILQLLRVSHLNELITIKLGIMEKDLIFVLSIKQYWNTTTPICLYLISSSIPVTMTEIRIHYQNVVALRMGVKPSGPSQRSLSTSVLENEAPR